MAEIKDIVRPLSEKLLPPPLKPGTKVAFRLLSIGKKEPGRDEPAAPEVYQLSGRETITDPFEEDVTKKRKVIGTMIQEYKPQNGVMLPVYKNPQFIRGWCVLTSDDYDQYAMMVRSLKCRNNKYRGLMGGARIKPIFELVEDSSKEVTEQMYLSDMRWHAEGIVRKSSVLELKAIATKLRASPDTRLHTKTFIPGQAENDFQGLKMELIHIATLYPKQLIAASEDKEAQVMVQIVESMRWGILVFDEGAYQLRNNKGQLDEIFKPSVDQDPVKALTAFFMGEGKQKYVNLANELKKELTPRA